MKGHTQEVLSDFLSSNEEAYMNETYLPTHQSDLPCLESESTLINKKPNMNSKYLKQSNLEQRLNEETSWPRLLLSCRGSVIKS